MVGQGYVIAGHNELGFTAQNVHALCDVGASTKQPGTSIGHKGIGYARYVRVATVRALIYLPVCILPSRDAFTSSPAGSRACS